jgi:hypothetical protein
MPGCLGGVGLGHWRGEQPLAIDGAQFCALRFGQKEHVPARRDVDLSAGSLKAIRPPRTQEFDLQFVAELADVANRLAHVIDGSKVTFQATLEYSAVQEIKGILNGLVQLLRELWIVLPVVVGHLAADSGMTS